VNIAGVGDIALYTDTHPGALKELPYLTGKQL